MTKEEILSEIREFFQAHADENIVKKYSKFFKEGYDPYGIPTELLMAKREKKKSPKKAKP